MTSTTHPSQHLALPITRSAREIASQFARQQPTAEKAEQVRLNTLAVCAVNDYCQMMGIATDVSTGDSWNPLTRLLANVADLQVVGVGRLECRPVSRTDRMGWIPPEVWTDRIGYLMVQLDETDLEATLLGFVPTPDQEPIPLSQLQSLEQLLDRIDQLRQSAVGQRAVRQGEVGQNGIAGADSSSSHATHLHAAHLGEWLAGQITSGWQTIETLLESLNAEPAFAFRGGVELSDAASEIRELPPLGLRRAKLIHLSTEFVDYPLVLVVEVIPRPDQRRSIYVQLHPIDPNAMLPEHLRLIGVDQTGAIVLETEARQADDYIQLRFRGRPGEPFRLQIQLSNAVLTEDFVI